MHKKHSKKSQKTKKSRGVAGRVKAGMDRSAAAATDLARMLQDLGLGAADGVSDAAYGATSVARDAAHGATSAARDAAAAAVSTAQAVLPPGPGGEPLVVMSASPHGAAAPARQGNDGNLFADMSDLLAALPRTSTRRTRGVAPRRYSDIEKPKTRKRSVAQKLGVKKAAATRARNKAQGFKSTAARQKSITRKAKDTRRFNRRFKNAAKDLMGALPDL